MRSSGKRVACDETISSPLKTRIMAFSEENINTLKVELNPICHLLILFGVHHIYHISRIKVKQQLDKN